MAFSAFTVLYEHHLEFQQERLDECPFSFFLNFWSLHREAWALILLNLGCKDEAVQPVRLTQRKRLTPGDWSPG